MSTYSPGITGNIMSRSSTASVDADWVSVISFKRLPIAASVSPDFATSLRFSRPAVSDLSKGETIVPILPKVTGFSLMTSNFM